MSHCVVVRSAAGTSQLLFSTTNAGIAPGRSPALIGIFAHSQLPRAAVKLSLALRSHFGEIKLPGLVGAWMFSCIFCTLSLWGKGNGCSAFRFSASALIMPLLLLWGRADIVALLFWLDSTSSMLSTSFYARSRRAEAISPFFSERAREIAPTHKSFCTLPQKLPGRGIVGHLMRVFLCLYLVHHRK